MLLCAACKLRTAGAPFASRAAPTTLIRSKICGVAQRTPETVLLKAGPGVAGCGGRRKLACWQARAALQEITVNLYL
jgi:hypothetical protein